MRILVSLATCFICQPGKQQTRFQDCREIHVVHIILRVAHLRLCLVSKTSVCWRYSFLWLAGRQPSGVGVPSETMLQTLAGHCEQSCFRNVLRSCPEAPRHMRSDACKVNPRVSLSSWIVPGQLRGGHHQVWILLVHAYSLFLHAYLHLPVRVRL